MAAKYYSPDFKLEAVRRLERTGEPLKNVAEELGQSALPAFGAKEG